MTTLVYVAAVLSGLLLAYLFLALLIPEKLS